MEAQVGARETGVFREVSVPGQREISPGVERIARAAAIVLPLLTIFVGLTGSFDSMTQRAGHLAFALPLIFLYYPARKGDTRRPTRLDLGLAVVSVIVFAWVVVGRERIMWRLVYVDPLSTADLVFGMLAVVLVIEATRRTLGWTLGVIATVFIVYALAGSWIPGVLGHKGVSFDLLVEHLYLVPEGVFNRVTGVMATYLMVFLTFGTFLRFSGGDLLFRDLTYAAAGNIVGGPAKAAVFGSMLMGSVTGSTIANVVTTGTITIPLMKRIGFRPVEAGAVETAAGVGGALMPPVMGAGVFIMSEITGIPLITILKFSLIPAVLFFANIYAYVHIKARKRHMVLGEVDESVGSVWSVLGRGFHLLLPLGLLIYLLVQNYSPFYASSASVLALWAMIYVRAETRMSLRDFLRALEATTRGALMLSATMANAAIVVGIISITGLMLKTTSIMISTAGGSLFLGIVIVALISTLLGMSLPITSAYVIVSTLGAPVLTELGMSLLGAHLIVFWFAQSATITPPICMTAFVAAQIAGGPPMRTGFEALRVAKPLYLVPFMFAFSSLLSSTWWEVVLAGFVGLMALLLILVGVEGFLKGALSLPARMVAGAAVVVFGLAVFSGDPWVTCYWGLLGLGLTLGIYLFQVLRGPEAAGAGGSAP
jgi:TRAP transporter 4TM/12TM fusion protein